MATSLLDVSGLHAFYGKSHVLHGVSLTVARGGVTAVLGRNGAGKTTLLKAVLNLLPAKRGQVVFDGTDISRWPTDAIARAGIAYVPQGPKVFPGLTVRENLRVAASAVAKARPIDDVLANFPVITALLDRPAAALSGGQQQIVAVARSLVMNCRVLVMDEPSDGLMPKLVQEVGETASRLAANGIGVLLVEQNLDLALGVADRVYVMEKGEIRFEGEARTLRDNPDIIERYLGVDVP